MVRLEAELTAVQLCDQIFAWLFHPLGEERDDGAVKWDASSCRFGFFAFKKFSIFAPASTTAGVSPSQYLRGKILFRNSSRCYGFLRCFLSFRCKIKMSTGGVDMFTIWLLIKLLKTEADPNRPSRRIIYW